MRSGSQKVIRSLNMGVGLVSLLLVALIVVFTESGDPILWGFSIRLWIFICVFFVVGCAFFYVGARSSLAFNQNVLVVMMSCGMGLLASEGLVRVLQEDPNRVLWEVKERREAGELIYPSVNPLGPGLNRLTPLPNAKTLLKDEGYGWITFRADENGFRNPGNLYSSNEKLDLFAVGDSYTMSCSVPQESDWIHLLRVHGKIKAYSAGVPGASALQELAILLKYGIPKRPGIVLWVFYDNDYVGLSDELKQIYLKQCLPEDLQEYFEVDADEEAEYFSDEAFRNWLDTFFEKSSTLDLDSQWKKKKPIIVWMRKYSKFIDFLIEITDERVLYEDVILEKTIQHKSLLVKILKEAKAAVQHQNGEFLFIYLPTFAHFVEKYRDIYTKIGDRTLDIAREAGVPVLDFRKDLLNEPDLFSLYARGREGGHFSVKGYRLLSDAVLKKIAKASLAHSSPAVAGLRGDPLCVPR
jgi:hypothetical protein